MPIEIREIRRESLAFGVREMLGAIGSRCHAVIVARVLFSGMRAIFSHRIEVRFRDCDPMGHVNNAVYLTYLEQARSRPPLIPVLFLLLVFVAGTTLTGAQATTLSAEAVARRVHDRDTGRDSRMTFRMRLFDRHNRARERVMTVDGLRGRGAPGVSPSAPEGDRLLIRFTYPNDIRGTAFLVWEHPDADDERFLFLPSLGRVRRIAGTEAQESFAGSDFTYEEIGGREFDEYTYAFAGPDGERVSWTPPAGGAPSEAWRLESKRKDSSAPFPRVVSLVLKDSFMVVQADIYNRRNERQKVYTVTELKQIEKIWTATRSEMTNALEKSRTELTVESADYNVGLRETDFSRRELERGSAHPSDRH
jgi:outer membrane lipoprotein-sorting protein/thioesterase superfamily protein